MYNSISLDFDGYYEEKDLPLESHNCSGVYVVYRGTNKSPTKLLYIGRTGDFSDRPSKNHHKYKAWQRESNKYKEELYFSVADTKDEEIAEAALIFKIKPELNEKLKDKFDYYETRVKASGVKAFIDDYFVVKQTS